MIFPITSPGQLAPLLSMIEKAPEVFLDTEADSMHHYFEKICLLQFTLPGKTREEDAHFLVDPLAEFDLAPLLERLQRPLLVLHGADYDLRMLRTDFEFTPSAIYDTMLAARLAGHPAVGLEAVALRYAGQSLDHAPQKADWSQRPLSQRMLDYAVNDTRFLPLIVENLRRELAALGRTEWHRQQCDQLIRMASVPRDKDASEAWRIKGSAVLNRQCLAILRELWRWRDAEARAWDRPAFMVCRGEQLLEWTIWAAEEKEKGSVKPSLPHHLPPRWRPDRRRRLEEALQKAWNISESEWPEPPPKGKRPPFNPEFSARMDRLRAARDGVAREANLDPSIFASNTTLAAIATRNPKKPEDFSEIDRWLPWQTEVLGKPFLEALENHSPA